MEHTQHSDAAYIKGAKIGYRGLVIDEIGMQHHWNRPVGTRWRLFFPSRRLTPLVGIPTLIV